MRSRRRIVGVIALLFPLALAAGSSASADTITVLGVANVFSAGNNATDHGAWVNSGNKSWGAPAPYFDLGGTGVGRIILFDSITGAVDVGGGKGYNGPEGFAASPNKPAWGGISGIIADRAAALLGVFTTDVAPTSGAPDRLDFRGAADFASLSPLLNQLFFIGDGLTGMGTGSKQLFHVPDNATRLYLGIADSSVTGAPPGAYQDNKGSFTADIRVVPEPNSLLIAMTGIGAAAALARRRRTKAAKADPA